MEILDTKGLKNLAVDHLSRLEQLKWELIKVKDVNDSFPDEHLYMISLKLVDEPWFADYAGYLVCRELPKGMMYQLKKKFFSELKYYF